MPTVVELERLRALVERLLPLATQQRGDVIRADNWNLVVGALIELARAVSTLETDQTVPSHEHTAEVTLDWLDPSLRQLIERGPLDDPIAVTRVLKVEQRATELSGSIASVDSTLKALRERLDETVTRDLVREHSMVKVTQKVDGIADARQDVLALRRTIGTIRTDLDATLLLRESLMVNGQPVRMQAFNDRVADLENLRERLRLPSGQLLDAITFEQRLQQSENRFLPREELDDILDARKLDLSELDLGSIRDDLRVQVTEDFGSLTKRLNEDVQSQLNTRLADVEKIVSGVVANTIPSLRESLTETIRSEMLSAVTESTSRLRLEFDKGLTSLRDELGSRVDIGITDLRKELGLTLEKSILSIQAEFSTELDGVRAELPGLKQQVTDLTASTRTSMTELEKKLSAQITSERTATDTRIAEQIKLSEGRTQVRIAESERATDARTQAAITKAQGDQATATQGIIVKEVDARIAEQIKLSESRTQSAITKALADQTTATQGLIAKEMDTRLQTFAQTLDSRIQNSVQKELGARLEGAIDKAVDLRLTEVEKQLRVSVGEEVKRQLGNSGGGGLVQPTGGDDFTKIGGIGAAFDDRLKSRGVRTYADLAKLKPAELATLLGRTEAEASAMIKEAGRLARIR